MECLVMAGSGGDWMQAMLLIAVGWASFMLFYRLRRRYLWKRVQQLEPPDSELVPSETFNAVGRMMASVAAKIGTRTTPAEAAAMAEASKRQLSKLIELDAPFARIGRELLLQGVLQLAERFQAKFVDDGPGARGVVAKRDPGSGDAGE